MPMEIAGNQLEEEGFQTLFIEVLIDERTSQECGETGAALQVEKSSRKCSNFRDESTEEEQCHSHAFPRARTS